MNQEGTERARELTPDERARIYEDDQRIGPHIAEIRRFRRMIADAERTTAGARCGLRASVAIAIGADPPPSDEAIAREAGWTVQQVAELRDQLKAP